jgi:hypothetical protein
MYSRALIGYEKVLGPDHPSSRSVRDKLQTLDTVAEDEALKGVEEPVHDSPGETSRLGPLKSKHNKLLKKLGLSG